MTNSFLKNSFIGVALLIAAESFAASEIRNPYAIQIKTPASAETGYFKLGTSRRPDGGELSLNSRSLLRDGKPWLPVMGEFHFARCPDSEWRDELLKMKAGGVDIVSTYVFWIHHEEVEGQFDWSGQRNLKKFIQTCADLNLPVIVRCGPWCHGEVRNGGLPDWVVKQKEYKPRTEDERFLAKVKILYGEIEKQLHGQLWKDGGPIIGIQLDNEFGGLASYLLALKKIAQDAGLDVPFYTRTGWPNLKTPMPLGEMAPLFGSYADGFWERSIAPMPGDNWSKFLFSSLRTDADIGADQLGKRKAQDESDVTKYPYLACEIMGGMNNAYHRRVLVNPLDSLSLATIHLGSGNNLPGYYMYHGGCNPDGKLSTMNESQASGYPNDLPVKNYDFQAPLGEFGEVNPSYHLLRRVHLFLRDFGPALAMMPPTLPEIRPTKFAETNMLRWAVRSDGRSGFVFVNNYLRLQPLPAKTNIQFTANLSGETLVFPERAITVPMNSVFFWPFNLDLGGVNLIYATAQPICHVDDGAVRTIFFAQMSGVPAEFVFSDENKVVAPGGKLDKQKGKIAVLKTSTGTSAAIRVESKDGKKIQIVLLDEAMSLALWKGEWAGAERAFLSRDALLFDGDKLRLIANKPDFLNVEMFPSPPSVLLESNKLGMVRDGIFTRFNLPQLRLKTFNAEVEQIKPAGNLREIPMSKGKNAIALAPDDADFSEAAVWHIKLPEKVDFTHDPILRIHYVGDVARVTLNDKLIQDDFYNGNYFDVGLRRFATELNGGELRLSVLPLRKDAPIYLAESAKPNFGKAESKVELKRVEIINRCEAALTAEKSDSMLIAFNKPYGVLSQFTSDGSPNRTLAEFNFPKNVYPVGRLDADSEGLLLLSDEAVLNQRLLHPKNAHEREYWAQVERIPTEGSLRKLEQGVVVQSRETLPARVWLLEPQPDFPPRVPPIRFRKTVPDCWIGLELIEGKNRQVRRMTAAIGHPTLRLVRVRIGRFELSSLTSGAWKILSDAERKRVLA